MPKYNNYQKSHFINRKSSRSIKWSPPSHANREIRKLNWVQPSPPSQSAHRSPVRSTQALPPAPHAPPSNTKLYYGLYGGKALISTPPLFSEPAQATACSVSRFHKDGLADIWGELKYADFISYVGVVTLDADAQINKVRLHDFVHNGNPSDIEKDYWSSVKFYSVADLNIFSTEYMYINPPKFQEIVATFKSTPCYQLSAGSIYKRGVCCPSSRQSDIVFKRSQSLAARLSNLKQPSGGSFIQIESTFAYLKKKEYRNLGEFLTCLQFCTHIMYYYF